MKNSEIVSRVLNTLKALTKDNRLSRRHVLYTLQQKSKFLISQKLNDKSLFKEDNLYKVVDCFELKELDVYNCDIVEFRSCNKLMKSKKKLPELIYSRYGASLKEVTSIDGEYLFKPTTLSQYRVDKKRAGFNDKLSFFYIKDGYLYLPNSEVQVVSLYILTADAYEAEQCSECSDKKCDSVWDFEFNCPDKLLEVVIQETIKELSMNRQIQADQNPNLVDNA